MGFKIAIAAALLCLLTQIGFSCPPPKIEPSGIQFVEINSSTPISISCSCEENQDAILDLTLQYKDNLAHTSECPYHLVNSSVHHPATSLNLTSFISYGNTSYKCFHTNRSSRNITSSETLTIVVAPPLPVLSVEVDIFDNKLDLNFTCNISCEYMRPNWFYQDKVHPLFYNSSSSSSLYLNSVKRVRDFPTSCNAGFQSSVFSHMRDLDQPYEDSLSHIVCGGIADLHNTFVFISSSINISTVSTAISNAIQSNTEVPPTSGSTTSGTTVVRGFTMAAYLLLVVILSTFIP